MVLDKIFPWIPYQNDQNSILREHFIHKTETASWRCCFDTIFREIFYPEPFFGKIFSKRWLFVPKLNKTLALCLIWESWSWMKRNHNTMLTCIVYENSILLSFCSPDQLCFCYYLPRCLAVLRGYQTDHSSGCKHKLIPGYSSEMVTSC